MLKYADEVNSWDLHVYFLSTATVKSVSNYDK